MLWIPWCIAFVTIIVATMFEWWRVFIVATAIWLALTFVMKFMQDWNNEEKS